MNGFARAQREWDNAEPPDWDGVYPLNRDCEEQDEDTGDVCGWSGRVDVYYTKTEEHWTCPGCSTEHIDNIEE